MCENLENTVIQDAITGKLVERSPFLPAVSSVSSAKLTLSETQELADIRAGYLQIFSSIGTN